VHVKVISENNHNSEGAGIEKSIFDPKTDGITNFTIKGQPIFSPKKGEGGGGKKP